MDHRQFDHLTRDLGTTSNRRQAFRAILAASAGVLVGWLPTSRHAAAASDCCPSDRPKRCSYTCVNLKTDAKNCGTCGKVCATGTICVAGVCDQAADFTKTAIVIKSATKTRTRTPTKTATRTATNTAIPTATPQCSIPSDCPGTDTECHTRTCIGGSCGVTFMASETPVANQTPGDCKLNVCDGAGEVITVTDNSDVPANTNDCATSVCTAGVASQPNLPQGTSCSGGVCDGSGQCIICPAGKVNCGTSCVDTTTDANNCGNCGQTCGGANAQESCVNSACVVNSCAAGFANCNGNTSDGCETNLNNDTNNCGACGRQCPAGATCQAGAC